MSGYITSLLIVKTFLENSCTGICLLVKLLDFSGRLICEHWKCMTNQCKYCGMHFQIER